MLPEFYRKNLEEINEFKKASGMEHELNLSKPRAAYE